MILKVTLTSGEVRLFDDVKRLSFSDKNVYTVCPPLTADFGSTKSIEKYVLMAFGFGEEELEEYDMNVVDAKKIYPLNGDESKLRRINKPIRNYHSEDEYTWERDDHDFRLMFIGRAYADERFCFKKIRFLHEDKLHLLITEKPVYVCNDSGKTIEVIK